MAEEIDLSPAEEAALDRAWARVGPLLAPAPTAPFSADAPDLSGLGDLLNLSRQEVLDALFDAAIDSFDLALPDAAFYSPDQPRVPAGQAGGGRWAGGVSPGTAAARDAASDAVRAFARGQGPPTVAEAEAVAGHLARLTVAGLHALKAEHGLKGGAPNKAALVAKLAGRFRAHRGRNAVATEVTPPATAPQAPPAPVPAPVPTPAAPPLPAPPPAPTPTPQKGLTASEPERVEPSAVDTPAQGVLNDARAQKAAAWKRVKSLREQIRKEPVGGNRSRLRLELMKAESAHHDAKMLEQKALAAIEARAQELGQTTKPHP